MHNARSNLWQTVTLSARQNARMLALSAAALLLLGVVLWFWGEPLWRLLTDEQALEALIERVGVWGPLALIALNVLQIVVAPIPGYVVSLSAGYLYGPLWGGIYAATGTLLGAMAAMWVGRTFGRPFVRAMLGAERMARWESVTHTDSPWVWFLLLLGPLGDFPYLLAGMSRIPYALIFLMTLVIRVPSVFLTTAIGGGAVPVFWLAAVAGAAATAMLVGLRYRARLSAWYVRTIKRAMHGRKRGGIQSQGHTDDEPAPAQAGLAPGAPVPALLPASTESRVDESVLFRR